MADILFTKRLFAATASGGSGSGNVDDVTINGQSVVSNKVARIVKASTSDLGVVKVDGSSITIDSSGTISSTGGGGSEEDNITITKNASDKIQTVGMIDQNSGYDKVWSGTLAEYNAIATKDANTLYFVEGDGDYQKIQFTAVPTASASYANRVIQYVGETDSSYTKGLWYVCSSVSGGYAWVGLHVEPIATANSLGVVKPDGTTITIDANGVISGSSSVDVDNTTITKNASNQIQTVGIIDQNTGYDKVWHGTKAEYDAITTKDANTIYFVDGEGGFNIQVYTMPTASADYENMAVQYLGTTTSDYTQGYWYICTASGSTYSWSQLNVQPNIDVQINGTSIVSSGVANVPIADASNLGVLKSGNSLSIQPNGVPYSNVSTYAQYTALGSATFIGKGTLENVITGRALETQTGTITSGTSLTMASNYVYSGTSLTSVILAYPASPTSTFTAQANFTTGTGTISFSVDRDVKMFGDDVSNSVFTPVANASYSIMFSYVNSVKTGIVIKIS